MPIATHKNQLPLPVRDKYRFLAPDADTQDLPPDWYFNFDNSAVHTSDSTCRYMRICGMATEILRGDRRLMETFPHKELQDYWGSRPRYEDGTSGGYGEPKDSTQGASGSGPAHVLAVEENPDEPPPPPYTLEAGDEPDKSPSPTREGFSTAPTSPNNQQNYNISDLANDLGRHSLGSPSHSPHPQIPGGSGPEPASSPRPNLSVPPTPAFANKPVPSLRPASPIRTSQSTSSYFSQPVGAPQDVGMPVIPIPEALSNPQHDPVNFNTPFHWNGDYFNPNQQSQPPGGFNTGTGSPTSPWDPQANNAQPQEGAPFGSGYQPSYSNPPLPGHHNGPPVRPATRPSLPPQSPHDGNSPMNSPPYPHRQSSYPGQVGPGSYYGYDQKTDEGWNDGWGGPPRSNSTYPGQVGPGSYYGYDQKTDEKWDGGWGGPPPSNSPYPGPPTSGQGTPPHPGSGYPQQYSYPGQTNGGPPPPSNSPPLSQGYGQCNSHYPGMTNHTPPGPPDRPPTRPPTSNSHSQGYGQYQSSYPGVTNPPGPGPDRPPTSYSSRPTPTHQSSLPPPIPGGFDYPSGPTQSTYGGINPSTPPPPPLAYQSTGPSPYGYQQQQSTYPGYNPPPSTSQYPGFPGTHPSPPVPPRE